MFNQQNTNKVRHINMNLDEMQRGNFSKLISKMFIGFSASQDKRRSKHYTTGFRQKFRQITQWFFECFADEEDAGWLVSDPVNKTRDYTVVFSS